MHFEFLKNLNYFRNYTQKTKKIPPKKTIFTFFICFDRQQVVLFQDYRLKSVNRFVFPISSHSTARFASERFRNHPKKRSVRNQFNRLITIATHAHFHLKTAPKLIRNLIPAFNESSKTYENKFECR